LDLSDYIRKDEVDYASLSSRSLVPIRTLWDLVAQPDRPCHYLTALRLELHTSGEVSVEDMRRGGRLSGEEMFSGPLGQVVAEVSTAGDTYTMRLLRAGITKNYMAAVLLRGNTPRSRMLERLNMAFENRITPELVQEHARWRRDHVATEDETIEAEAETMETEASEIGERAA